MICATTWLKALNIWTMVFLLGIVSTCTSGQSPCFGFGCKVSNISTSVWTYITTYIGMVRGTTNRDPIWKVSALWLSFKILQITLQKYKVWSINSRHMHLELELQEGSGTSDIMFFITTHRILYTYQEMDSPPSQVWEMWNIDGVRSPLQTAPAHPTLPRRVGQESVTWGHGDH